MIKPMLACNKPWTYDNIRHWPVGVSAKLDGVRLLLSRDRAQLRSGRNLTNTFISTCLLGYLPDGVVLDGELVTYNESGKMNTFHTSSGLIRAKDSKPTFIYHVFDVVERGLPYVDRISMYVDILKGQLTFNTLPVHVTYCHDVDHIEEIEHDIVDTQGHEGLIIRDLSASYIENHRCTVDEGYIFKLCRWVTKEAVIEEVLQACRAGTQMPKDTVGSIRCTDVEDNTPLVAGSGLDEKLALDMYNNPSAYIGRHLMYKYKPHGSDKLPRQPIFVGFKDDVI